MGRVNPTLIKKHPRILASLALFFSWWNSLRLGEWRATFHMSKTFEFYGEVCDCHTPLFF